MRTAVGSTLGSGSAVGSAVGVSLGCAVGSSLGATLGAYRYNRWSAGNTNVYVQDGSFVKLRELSATYSVDWAPITRIFRGGLDVTLAGRNLKTWTDYTGWDPETNVGAQRTLVRGFSFATTPIPRNVTLGVTLNY